MNSQQLIQKRKLLKWSQEKMAKELGMTRVMINMMENGKREIERRTALAVDFLVILHFEANKDHLNNM